MIDPLSPSEIRVLGALAEKALATPDYYPMSLNALVAACNQKTGRDPVMELGNGEVASAVDQLMRRRLAGTTTGAGSRVEKYRHLLDHAFQLAQDEVAVLAVLLLRGPQTAGEIRSRTARLFEFETLEEAEATISRMAGGDEPLVMALPIQPGRKEPRFLHLLGGEPDFDEESAFAGTASGEMASARERGDRIDALDTRLRELEDLVQRLQAELQTFRQQFE